MTHILDTAHTAQTTARYQDINKQEFLDQVKDLDLIPFKVEVENEGITFILTQDARWAKRSAKRAGA